MLAIAVKGNQKAIISETYKKIRTNIKYSSFDKEYRTIVITSSEKDEGKSSVAANLAVTFAQGEDKVLLIDCDLRRPSLHRKFKISNKLGISDMLIEKLDINDVVTEYNKNLTILTSGKMPPNPAEMLASQAMTTLLEELKEEFDYIILDTPPLMAVTDAQLLSTKADGVILVARYGKTKREIVQSSMNLIKKVNGNVIGSLLTRAEYKKEEQYYYGIEEDTRKSRRAKKKESKNLKEKEILV